MQNRRVALIPAYQPNSDMAQLVQEIRDTGFQIVVVDDESSPEKEEVFRMAAKNAVILKHNENRGKGRALKTGLDYIYSKFSADCVVVTVDADGQHKPNDVERVCKEAENHAGCLILGSRKMKGTTEVPDEDVPQNVVDLDDEDVPLDNKDLDRPGSTTNRIPIYATIAVAAATALAAAGFVYVKRFKKK